MTESELVNLTLEATGKTEQQLPRFRILALLRNARTQLADQVWSSGDRQERELLRKTFPVVVSDAGGLAPLGALLDADEPLLLKHLNSAEIKLGSITRRLTLLPDESAVRRDHMAGFPFGALIGTSLLVWNGGAPFVGNVLIRGPFVPTLENINTPLDERFVTIVSGMAVGQLPSPQRKTAQELKTVTAEGK